MLTYVDTNITSRGVQRVVSALKKYYPELTSDESKAELIFLHITGDRDKFLSKTKSILNMGKKYVVIQYAFKSTQKPNREAWFPIWSKAELVWSYYDLGDGFNFYQSPLGVDEVFTNKNLPRIHTVCTSGLSYLTESVRECNFAAKAVGGNIVHIGANIGNNIDCRLNITDEELSRLYSQCSYVSGLRRIEGFELPAAEGLLCGSVPVLFDKPHYRKWYEPWGVFIPELSREETIKNLIEVFSQKPKTINNIDLARKRFSWQSIIAELFNRI